MKDTSPKFRTAFMELLEGRSQASIYYGFGNSIEMLVALFSGCEALEIPNITLIIQLYTPLSIQRSLFIPKLGGIVPDDYLLCNPQYQVEYLPNEANHIC